MKTSVQTFLLLMILGISGQAMGQVVTIGEFNTAVPGGNAVIDVTYDSEGSGPDAVSIIIAFSDLYDDVFIVQTDGEAKCNATVANNTLADCLYGKPFGAGDVFLVTAGADGGPGNGRIAQITFTLKSDVPLETLDPLTGSINDFDGGSIVDGQIFVPAGPQPAWGDSLIGPEPDELSGQISTTIETIVVIDNGNGDPDSMLDYECTETADPDEKFSQTGDLTGLLAVGETGQMTIACDSSEEGSYTGEVQCTHNGDGDGSDSPVIGPLACTVTPGPEPAYTGVVSGLVMSAVEQGDADPAGSVTVSNSGDDGTTLTGECTISMGDSEISISNGAFGLMPSDGEQVVAVSCDASAEGDFSATVSCAHNGTNTASPAEYGATCEVGPPGPAVYASSPVGAGGIIDLTPGDDAVVGDSSPEATLTITNDAAEANDADLGLSCSLMTANQISASSPAATVAAQDSTQVTFSCNTDNPGSFSDTYTCGYTGTESDGDAVYTVNCGVRDAESDISESPSSGTPLSISVPLGGTGQTSVLFTEILVEGESGTLHGCWFDDGQYFSVLTSIADETVDSGESVEVVVQGTDPGTGVAQSSDTLNCNYSDSDNEQTEVSWPVTLNILPAAIPTLSTWGLLALILTMMGLGGIIIRRKVVS